MERNFTNENVEEFLRRNADELRMRPSAKVWKAISSQLKWRRRKIGFVLGTSLLLTTALGYYFISKTPGNSQSVNTTVPSKSEQLNSKQSVSAPFTRREKQVALAANPTKRFNNPASQPATATTQAQQFILNNITDEVKTPAENAFVPTVVDYYFESGLPQESRSLSLESTSAVDPLSIESVINSFEPKMRRKLGWQVYFTPTVSYRKLSDNYIDNVATHKPAFGFEMGLAAKYPIAKNVKLRAGLQFNVNRYEIKTFDSYTQLATIRLNDGNRVNYVSTVTNYNNFAGYRSNWLENFYLQVSAPVGIEFKIKGDNKMQFGVASTLQPTYLLGDRAYLISADYKNYAEMQGLVRKWNINTSLETFVAYSTGRLNWQVGPQVRYQMLSSYLQKYPVKENLFDFGLKVGLSVNKQ